MRDDEPRLARLVLWTFLLTFAAARVMVLLIMTHRAPDLYLHVGGNHVHHLNYGIFLLSAVGAYLLFARPAGRAESAAAIVYAVGLALTFDEFGMWLHLGGPYWQRASFDAVVVIAALLGLLAFAPSVRRFKPRHWIAAAVITAVLVPFALLLKDSLRHAEQRVDLRLERIEAESPP
jgi:hypothetical protein